VFVFVGIGAAVLLGAGGGSGGAPQLLSTQSRWKVQLPLVPTHLPCRMLASQLELHVPVSFPE